MTNYKKLLIAEYGLPPEIAGEIASEESQRVFRSNWPLAFGFPLAMGGWLMFAAWSDASSVRTAMLAGVPLLGSMLYLALMDRLHRRALPALREAAQAKAKRIANAGSAERL